jgi:hypothetical protein
VTIQYIANSPGESVGALATTLRNVQAGNTCHVRASAVSPEPLAAVAVSDSQGNLYAASKPVKEMTPSGLRYVKTFTAHHVAVCSCGELVATVSYYKPIDGVKFEEWAEDR